MLENFNKVYNTIKESIDFSSNQNSCYLTIKLNNSTKKTNEFGSIEECNILTQNLIEQWINNNNYKMITKEQLSSVHNVERVDVCINDECHSSYYFENIEDADDFIEDIQQFIIEYDYSN